MRLARSGGGAAARRASGDARPWSGDVKWDVRGSEGIWGRKGAWGGGEKDVSGKVVDPGESEAGRCQRRVDARARRPCTGLAAAARPYGVRPWAGRAQTSDHGLGVLGPHPHTCAAHACDLLRRARVAAPASRLAHGVWLPAAGRVASAGARLAGVAGTRSCRDVHARPCMGGLRWSTGLVAPQAARGLSEGRCMRLWSE